MFSQLDDTQNLLLTLLLALWAAFLFGGFIFGKINAERTHRMRTWTRMASSLALVAVGWGWFLFLRDTPAATYALLVAVGMSFGFVGDLFMARLFPIKDYVLDGIGSFGIGHIFYIVAFVTFGNQQGLGESGARWGALVFWLLVGVLGWYIVVFRGQQATFLHYAALPYALLLASTAGFATGLALQSAGFVPLAVGAALFLLSDLILAAQLFNNLHFRLIGDIVWLTYGPAQMLIVISVYTALLVTQAG
ncbi:MAG: lysoplasmalogenase [Anaerolineaceae bacterium]|nr:lysoplasmalogenase [Anaerolineaceae bacterium]